MIVRGQKVDGPPVRTWLDGEPRYASKGKRDTAVSIVIHETCTRSAKATHAALKSRELGIHLMVDEEGNVTQHADLASDIVWHSGKHNSASIGIEVVSPYYPTSLKPGDVWNRVIKAGWAHRKEYVLPTIESAEATFRLVDWLTRKPAPGLDIPLVWRGMLGSAFHFQPVAALQSGALPGVYSHLHVGNHADGSWLNLYCVLRLEHGMSPWEVYEVAASEATGTAWLCNLARFPRIERGSIEVPPMPWTEEHERQLEDVCPGSWASLTSEPVCY